MSSDEWDGLFCLLPPKFHEKNLRLRRKEDKQRNLFGLLLLSSAMRWQGFSMYRIEDLILNQYGRPYWGSGNMDFNISHSGAYVVCAVSPGYRVGVDVEAVREVNFDDFTRTMNTDQWAEIRNSRYPVDTFFRYWTIKESVIKADGRGLSIPLTDIVMQDNTVSYDDTVWHFHQFDLDSNHKCSVASDKLLQNPTIVAVKWQDFLIEN